MRREKKKPKRERERNHERGAKLRLVSWNVHGVPDAPRSSERMATIARVVAARSADLVLLQEVWNQGDAEALIAALTPAGYASVEVPVAFRSPTPTAGLLCFVRSAAGWRAEKPRFHEFGAEAFHWQFWDSRRSDEHGALGFTLARDNLALAVWNTHLEPADEPGDHAEVRRSQLIELRSAVEGGGGGPALIAGDLETAPDEPAFSELAGFDELSRALRERCRCGTSIEEPPRVRWLDYLLARTTPGWRITAEVSLLRSLAPDNPYSDHQGLDAIVQLERRRAEHALAWLTAASLAEPTTRRELLANAALLLLGRG